MALAAALPAQAFSSGATVCEVSALPFAPMATVLRSPPPAGWSLIGDASVWYPGALRVLRLRHPDPQRRARGLLLWVKGSAFGSPTGAGRFVDVAVSDLYQFVSAAPPENCAEWALTHQSAASKAQSDLLFAWQAPSDIGWGNLIARAFVIEDCGGPLGSCRDAQALTEFLILREVVYADSFE